jgi:ankyrin repeat protein
MEQDNYQKIIFELITIQKWDAVEKILEKKIDPDIRDSAGNYLIHLLIYNNQYNLIKLLLKLEPRLDILDPDGKQICYLPIRYNQINILKLLLEYNNVTYGIDITNFRDANQYSPLFYAIKFNSIESAKLILDYGGRLNTCDKNKNTPLHQACLLGNEKLIKIFLDYYPEMIQSINIEKQIPLHLLILGNNKIIKIMLNKINHEKNLELITAQDINDRTPLMYAIEIQNISNIQELLDSIDNKEKEIVLELQDAEGNTHYHLAIKFKINLDMFIPPNINTCKKINTDGNTILHLLLINNLTNYFPDIIKHSSLLIQNNENNTPLHYLIPEKWKKYNDILENKKLSVFLKNKNGISPWDVIYKTNDSNKFLDVVIKSYYNQLIMNPEIEYVSEWETKCSNKKLDQNKCILEIKNNINNGISYPQKKKNYCINITTKLVANSSYTGITVDIIGGLIILKTMIRQPIITSLLLPNIITNYKLTDFYKNNRIIRNDFLNFEIIWSYQTIFFPNDLEDLFNKFLNDKKIRYFIIPVGIELSQGSHANILIYDKEYNELERFEPDGSKPPNGFFYFPDELDTYIYQYFKNIFKNKDFEYRIPNNSIPRISFQKYEILETNSANNRGYCGAWCSWYAYQRIRTGIKMKKLIPKLLQKIRGSNMTFKQIIRNYASLMANIRDNLFNKSNLILDDWFNNINSEQLSVLSSNITKMI